MIPPRVCSACDIFHDFRFVDRAMIAAGGKKMVCCVANSCRENCDGRLFTGRQEVPLGRLSQYRLCSGWPSKKVVGVDLPGLTGSQSPTTHSMYRMLHSCLPLASLTPLRSLGAAQAQCCRQSLCRHRAPSWVVLPNDSLTGTHGTAHFPGVAFLFWLQNCGWCLPRDDLRYNVIMRNNVQQQQRLLLRLCTSRF